MSPYRSPAMVALRSARISPDFASSVALDLKPAMQLHQRTVGAPDCSRGVTRQYNLGEQDCRWVLGGVLGGVVGGVLGEQDCR